MAPGTAPTAPADALPMLAPMFGRDGDLGRLLALLLAHRLVALLGPPGVGKTRLAQAVVAAQAAQAAQGRRALLVDLATPTSGAMMKDAVSLALGPVDSSGAAPPSALWLDRVVGAPTPQVCPADRNARAAEPGQLAERAAIGHSIVPMPGPPLSTPALEPSQRHAALVEAQARLDTLPRAEYSMAVRHTLAQSARQLGDAGAALATVEQTLTLPRGPDGLARHRAGPADPFRRSRGGRRQSAAAEPARGPGRLPVHGVV